MTSQTSIRSSFEKAGGKFYALNIQQAKREAARFFLDLLRGTQPQAE